MLQVTLPVPHSLIEARNVLVSLMDLSDEVKAKEERSQAQRMMANTALSTIDAIAATIEKRDPYTAGHQRSVADIALAISSHRPYRPAKDRQVAIAEIEKMSGTHFATEIADACLMVLKTGND